MTPTIERPGSVSTARASLLLALSVTAAVAFLVAGVRGVEPMATWLYPFVWYPLLLGFEGAFALRRGRFLLLERPSAALSIILWSVPFWMIFELLNLRLENWYYVFVPDDRLAAWTGIVISFATVMPAVLLPSVLTGIAETDTAVHERPLSSGWLRAIRGLGLIMILLPMIWPHYFFPLVWGGLVLLPEPDLCRSDPRRSLLYDVIQGRFRRVLALLAGGAIAGLVWEALNYGARSKWIYTVPFLEELKLFEMPPLGFFGFPVFALSCHTVLQWLGMRGWAPSVDLTRSRIEWSRGEGAQPGSAPKGMRWAILAALVVALVALVGMEQKTISSRTPRLRDIPGVLPAQVETLTVWGAGSVFALAELEPDALADRIPGIGPEEARRYTGTAGLVVLRGIGTRHARFLHGWGVTTVSELARVDPDSLMACYVRVGSESLRPPQIRVWVRSARRRVEVDGLPPHPVSCR